MSDKRARRTLTTELKLAIFAEAADDRNAAPLDQDALDPAPHFTWKRKLAKDLGEGPQHGHTMA